MSSVSTRRRYSPRLPREERREQLLDATLAVIARDGYGGVSMEAVAREADIAKTVVYDSFGDRRTLLQALLEREQERALSDLATAMPAPPIDGAPAEILAAALTAWLEAVRRHPDTWRLILMPAEGTPPVVRADVEKARERLLSQMEPLVEWGLRERGLDRVDPELAAQAIVAIAENAARLTLTRARRFPPRRIAEFAGELVSALGQPPAVR
jgi:AcrR family transcriptional regulator